MTRSRILIKFEFITVPRPRYSSSLKKDLNKVVNSCFKGEVVPILSLLFVVAHANTPAQDLKIARNTFAQASNVSILLEMPLKRDLGFTTFHSYDSLPA